MVDLSLLDEQLSLSEKKFRDKQELWQEFITKCKSEAEKKQKELNADTNKTKNLIEQSVFANFLNEKLVERHIDVFSKTFQLGVMNYKFVEKYQEMGTADKFKLIYDQVTECQRAVVNNPFRQEYLDHKEAEMDKFNGKMTDDKEGKSETSFSQSKTSVTQGVKPSIKDKGARAEALAKAA